MPAPLVPGLSPAAASRICMDQCRAMCCRGALILSLAAEEIAPFEDQAAALGVPLYLRPAPNGDAWVRFPDHPGERCPMLDPATFACRIYAARPQRCRAFPERPTPGCAISGAD